MGKTGLGEPSRGSIFGRWALTLVALVALLLIALAPAANAQAPGQVGKAWGEFGTGKAQFNNPGIFGVDPVDGSVYAGDVTSGGTRYRLQKLSAEGEFKASVEVPRWLNDKPSEEKILSMHGIAADHEKGLIYVVEGCRVASGLGTCRVFGGVGFNARRILVYKTAPEGEKLVPAETPAFTLPIGAEELYEPQAIAVDPSNHDVVLLAENSAAHLVVQRISSSGVLGARYTDTANTLKPSGGNSPASSLAVAPDGTIYTIAGGTAPGSKNTRAWQLPQSLASLEAVPGFAAAAEAEGWARGLQAAKSNQLIGGPQLAISPDGSTLYWKEKVIPSLTSEAGVILVRGYSLKDKASTALFGGGTKGASCEITTSSAGLATTGEQAVVFDFGPEVEEGKKPAYGVKVLTFGPGGSACPPPTAKFQVNKSKAEEVTVTKGDVASFDAAESEVGEQTLTKLEWSFGDGTTESAVSPKEGEPPAKAISHRYLKAGKYTAKLKLSTLEEGQFPQPAEVIVNVVGGKPTASFTASTTTPTGGEIVEFDAGKSFDPTGGACTQEAGCPGSNALQDYHWDFGDGGTKETSTAIVSHLFENSGASALERTVSLTVTSFDGVTSAPSQLTIEVQPSSAPFCNGSDILGVGSELQRTAQSEIWGPGFESGTCSGGPKVNYIPSGSSLGLRLWNADGKSGAIETNTQFVGTDGAPDGKAIGNVTGATAGAHLLTIPVAQTSISIVANPPVGCTVDEITNQDLDQVFRGNHAKWSKIASAEGSCESPITRVVRGDASPITTQFKNYLYLINGNPLACTTGSAEGKATWQELEPIGEAGAPNTTWPKACGEQKFLSAVATPAKGGDGAVVNEVNATDGSIGYAITPEVRALEVPGTTVTVALQNNGWKKLAEATFAPSAVGSEANCSDAYYIVPPEGRRMPAGSGLDVDWSQVSGGRPGSGGTGYSLCMLTYDLAFHGYQAAGFTFKNYKTVHDYLRQHVVAAGQGELSALGGYYAPLPSSGTAKKDVLGAARYSAGKITW
jgi:hypothetical protein